MAQKHTVTDLRNGSGHALSLSGHEVWEGSQSTDFPKTIMNGDSIQFTHNAGTDDGSIAALAYKLQDDGKMWVVAWSNPRGADSKAFTDLLDQPVDWDQIKTELDANGSADYKTVKFNYRAEIKMDPKSASPVVTAYLEKKYA
ncbi:hypothetical protein CXB51_024704 [Gossypium anomalum]|nr:hypothetical protein CXB51_024704 [Gossypium anomalum]